MILCGLVTTLWLALGACHRGPPDNERRSSAAGVTPSKPLAQTAGVVPGIAPQFVLGNRRNPYAGDPTAAAAGRKLFVGFNCAGCHSAYAGGGMGPSLRDSLWIYGSSDAQIFSTIAEGRPYGMPAWGGRLPDDLIWRLVTYIHTLGTKDEPEKPPVPASAKASG